MSKASSAKTCFIENREHFGSVHTQQEKYNLYNGLALLAEAVEELEHEIRVIKSSLPRR